MYAIIETGGKQYKVENGDVLNVERLDVEAGKKVVFDKVLVLNDDKDVKVGTPYLDGITVEGKVVENGKGKKIIVFKYKAKKDSKSKQGHRQPYTMVEITKLAGSSKASKPQKDAKKATKEEPKKDAKKAAKAEPKKEVKKAAKKEDKGVSASMKKDELLQYAKDHDIKVDAKAKKADIIEAINSAK